MIKKINTTVLIIAASRFGNISHNFLSDNNVKKKKNKNFNFNDLHTVVPNAKNKNHPKTDILVIILSLTIFQITPSFIIIFFLQKLKQDNS